MASFRSNWIAQASRFFNTWSDIAPATFTGTLGAVTVRGFSLPVAAIKLGQWVSSFQGDECLTGTVAAPPTPVTNVDPPYPPVYPYLFATDTIYGREHVSLNLKMVRGDTYQFNATIILDGVPVDLTGGTVRMTAKWAVANADNAAVFQLSSATTGITVTDAVNGKISVTIASDKTSSLPAKKVELPYDIQFVDSTSKVFTVLYGTLTIVPDVTITA